ncbi:MAG: helix-turn-helix domain-containing protein [Desulfobacterales bacterium]|nr:helix-turn-helix domain-containing protein [Desulfobacterales bacterium]
MKAVEARYIRKALTRAGFNVSKAGRFLNLSPQALRYKIKRLNIHIPQE